MVGLIAQIRGAWGAAPGGVACDDGPPRLSFSEPAAWAAPGRPKTILGRYTDWVALTSRPTDSLEAIGHTARSFKHAEVVEDVIRDRLADPWDERVAHIKAHPEDTAELKDFSGFIRSSAFPSSWWLLRLAEALELDGELETNGMIGEQLAAAADELPRVALDALTMLLGPDEKSAHDNYDLRTHALAPVIAAALKASDSKLQEDARSLINLMGERGEIDLERRVEAIVGSIPEADTPTP